MSSGFAFVHADSSADVCAIEAVKLEDLDPEAVRSGLQVNDLLAAASLEISAFRGSACIGQYRTCPLPYRFMQFCSGSAVRNLLSHSLHGSD